MKQKFAWQILLFIGQSSALAHGVKVGRGGGGNGPSGSRKRIVGSRQEAQKPEKVIRPDNGLKILPKAPKTSWVALEGRKWG